LKEAPYAWVVVWATFFALAVIFGVSYSFAAFFESLAGEFDARRADVSLVFGLSGGVYFVFGAAGGMLADRFGPRAVTCTGMLLIAAGLVLCSAAESMVLVYAAYGVGVGLGIALVYTPSIACVQPWFTHRRGLAAGLASAGIGAGTVAVPLIASALIAAMQWRDAMRALAAGVLVLGLCATWLLKRAPAASAKAGGAIPGARLAQALCDRRFWWLYLGIALAAPAMFIPFAHVSASARDLGIGEARAVGLVGLVGIGSLVGRFVIGALADRIGRTLTLALMQLSAGLAYLAWVGAGGYATLVVFALWFGLSYGGIVSLLPAICMDLFGARAVAGIIGTLYTGAALGNLFGPVLAGAIFDRTGSYAPVLWACLAASLLAALTSWRLLALRRPGY
jgi:MFS transporter, MCT family, solute carrier family 16 (monocarboxylic acid transporters), member 13